MDEVQEMKVEPKPVKMESASTKIENTTKGTEIFLSVFNIYVDIL